MSYPLPPYRFNRRKPAPAPVVPAIPYDPPFGSCGETTAPRPYTPPPPAPEPLHIPPPPWADGGLPEPPVPLEPLLPALATMKEYDPPDLGLPAPPPAPLERFVPPPPDWEAEAKERAERDRAEAERVAREHRAELLAQLLEEAEQGHQSYPAKPKRAA